jgi:hypothetical protein
VIICIIWHSLKTTLTIVRIILPLFQKNGAKKLYFFISWMIKIFVYCVETEYYVELVFTNGSRNFHSKIEINRNLIRAFASQDLCLHVLGKFWLIPWATTFRLRFFRRFRSFHLRRSHNRSPSPPSPNLRGTFVTRSIQFGFVWQISSFITIWLYLTWHSLFYSSNALPFCVLINYISFILSFLCFSYTHFLFHLGFSNRKNGFLYVLPLMYFSLNCTIYFTVMLLIVLVISESVKS